MGATKRSSDVTNLHRKALRNASNATRPHSKSAGKRVVGGKARSTRGKTNKKTNKQTPSVIAQTPPPGLQFMTTFDCKYYGSNVAKVSCNSTSLQSECTRMIKSAIKRNSKQHLDTLLQVSDKGVAIIDKYDGNGVIELATDDILLIVPGILTTKSGKRYTLAILVEYRNSGDVDPDRRPYHVFQFRHREDAAFMHEASKRMWRDHMFSNLLDISTEDGQDGFDSFVIERDIEIANKRCSAILEKDMAMTAKRCSSLIQADLDLVAAAMGEH